MIDILISRFQIHFTLLIRNSLSGRFPISSSFVWFGGHLSCSFICWVFLCLILFKLLSLGCPFCILAVCGVLYSGISSLCVGLYRCLVKISWLGKLVSVFWWVELKMFSLECNKVSSSEFWGQIRKGQRKPYGSGSRESGGSGGQGPILICIPVLVPLPE